VPAIRSSRPRSNAAREELLGWVARERIRPGSQLPPEPLLASKLGVSRATLRDALGSLEAEGLVTRTRGSGTFLAHRPRARNNLDVNFGVSEAIRAAGMRPGYEESVTRLERAGDEAERLGLSPEDEVVVVERVRTADGRRVVFSVDVLPAELLAGQPDVLTRLGRDSLYDTMERELGIVIHHGVATFSPVKASAAIARKLHVTAGTTLLKLDQVDYDDGGRSVLSSHEHHLADAFEFIVIRRGPGRRFK
jgi:GntR family transcriptional regulator